MSLKIGETCVAALCAQGLDCWCGVVASIPCAACCEFIVIARIHSPVAEF